jgi:hypothetical protein
MYKRTNEFNWSYQPRSYFTKDENCDPLADSHTILNRRKKYFSQLLNVHRASDVRQIEIHTVEPLVSDPKPFEVKSDIANQIPAEQNQAGSEILRPDETHIFIYSIWNKKELPDQWKESINMPI